MKSIRISLLLIIGIFTPIFTYLYANQWEIVNIYPHDPNAFTQGLYYKNGTIVESTGLYGKSDIRITDLKTGSIKKSVKNSATVFAEGVCEIAGTIYQLSWKEQLLFTYNKDLELEATSRYPIQEGWGCTTDGTSLIVSDGTNIIRFLNPKTLAITKSLSVMNGFTPVKRLNELEWIKGSLWANIWQTNSIVQIDPKTGRVLRDVDFSRLKIRIKKQQVRPIDAFNGIAWVPERNTFLLTGKLWPSIFEVKIHEK